MINFQGKSLIRSGLKGSLLEFIKETGVDNSILFIHMQSQLDELSSILTDIAKEGIKPRLVCINADIPMHFEGLKDYYKDIKLGENYLDVPTLEYIDDFVNKLTTKWYLFDNPEFKKVVNYHSINLGLVLEYDFLLFLIKRIKMLEMLDSVIKKERPAGLAIISDSPEDFFGLEQLVENAHDIKFMKFFSKMNKQTTTFVLKRDLIGLAADFITNTVDYLMRNKILIGNRFKNKILIDKRVYEDLYRSASLPDIFISTPFEKGLNLRFAMLKKERSYYPFYFPSNIGYRTSGKNLMVFRRLKAQLFAQDLFRYKNFSIGDIAKPKLEEYFRITFPRMARNIDFFERFFKKNSSKGIVLRHDLWELQRLSVELCKKYKIPSMVVQHGVVGEKIERIIFADKIAVWGDMCARIYKSFGNQESKCVVTGNPKHDVLRDNAKPKFSRKEICEQLKLDSARDIIVLLSAHDYLFNSAYMNRDRYEVIVKHILKAMNQLADKQLVIKLHPYENGAFPREAIKYFNMKNAVVVKDIDLYSLLGASDLVMSKESSAGLKALILDKPFITLDFEKRADVIPYAPSGAALGVYKTEDILTAIKEVFSNDALRMKLREKAREFVRDYAYAIDGKSSERVLKMILETTNASTNRIGAN